MFIPVVSKKGKPLMPTTPYRARKLIKAGKAIKKFKKGLFYILLTERMIGKTQDIAVGIDPGIKKEAFTIKSNSHTYLNIQIDAINWVKDNVKTRSLLRRSRRQRKTPYRKCRLNRKKSKNLQPSIKARWQWKLRIINFLVSIFPITYFIVEDIKAKSKKNCKKWNMSFSPLEDGKNYFYTELRKQGNVELKMGYDTAELRNNLKLEKSYNKNSNKFEAHCIDSFVLANWFVGGHLTPDNKNILLIKPIELHRRQLHRLQPSKKGIRRRYGSTNSLGFKRGSLVKHVKYGLCYVGGYLKNNISLHNIENGKRITQKAELKDCICLNFNAWKISYLFNK